MLVSRMRVSSSRAAFALRIGVVDAGVKCELSLDIAPSDRELPEPNQPEISHCIAATAVPA